MNFYNMTYPKRQNLATAQMILNYSTSSGTVKEIFETGNLPKTEDEMQTLNLKNLKKVMPTSESNSELQTLAHGTELRDDSTLSNEKGLTKTNSHEVIEKWWDEGAEAIVIKKRRDDVSSIYCPRTKTFVEVPFDSWTGSPIKDVQNALRHEEIKYITSDRETKVQGAFMKLKRRDFDTMARHYEEEKEKEDAIPLIAKRPTATIIGCIFIWIILTSIKAYMD